MSAQERVADAVGVLVTVVEACGAAIIGVGAVFAFIRLLIIAVRSHDTASFASVRLNLGRYLVLGLEFQLAGDVLRTAITPSFHDIGQLAAIAAIRTVLNHVLRREIDEERRQVSGDKAVVPEAPPKP
jgi:uncharacterized membrane protein